jgi:hypothetical protein
VRPPDPARGDAPDGTGAPTEQLEDGWGARAKVSPSDVTANPHDALSLARSLVADATGPVVADGIPTDPALLAMAIVEAAGGRQLGRRLILDALDALDRLDPTRRRRNWGTR